MKNYIKKCFLIVSFGLFLIISSNFIMAYRGIYFNIFGKMESTYDLICGIVFGLIALIFLLIYTFSPPYKFPGLKKEVLYNQACKKRLKEKFELIDKVEKDYKKEVYTVSSLLVNETLIFIESKNISADVFKRINDEIDLFCAKVKNLNNKKNILYIICRTESVTQEDETAIVSKVVGYRYGGGANSIVMPIIINTSDKYLEVCPLEYKYFQDYFLYNQMEHKFIEYLENIEIITTLDK